MAKTFKVPEIGDVIAEKYRIEEQIGRGGFGVVFKATQLGMERIVALKTLLPQAMAHEDMVERFRREAVHARNLNHPNTIRLYDFGQTEGGLLYISMEFLDGKPLDSIIKHSGPLSTARVKNIGTQILKSLAEAHQNGIVHRDLKPANIFVIQVVGEDDFVKVLDFGIAKAFEAEEEEGKLTKTGIGFGTPFYMAPEQVRGRDICPATDLYALGLVMTECLTGETVYSGTSSMEIAVKQLSEEPPPIPEWVLRGPLGPVIQRATQKDIRTRYPSAVEMLRDLKAVDPNATIDISTRLNTGAIIQQAQQQQKAEKKGLPVGLVVGLVAVAAIILLLAAALGVVFFGGFLEGVTQKPVATTDKPVDKDGKDPSEKDGGKTGGEVADKGEDDKAEDGKGEDDKAETPPATVSVSINTQPEGASLYRNGEDTGLITPCKVDLKPGEGPRDYEARLEGFKNATITVSPDGDKDYKTELEVDTTVPDKVADRRDKTPKTPRSAIANKDAGKTGTDVKAGDAKAGDTKKPDDKPLIPKIGGGAPDKGKDKDKGTGTISIPKL